MTDNPLVTNLQNPNLYSHEVKSFRLIETHISWVILTGSYVYKIKKPMDFGFLNFTTLEKRKFFCEKELELNKRLAAELYLEVLPITGSVEKPEINGKGPIIEYAIKMKEFSQDGLFTSLLEHNQLTINHIEDVAVVLADFHEHASKNGPKELGTAKQVHEPVIENFDQIRPLLSDPKELARIDKLEAWANEQHRIWHHIFETRQQNGFIRECHGDIHLGNITLINNKPVIFDCIEFNEPFRWTDVMADLGFLIMDLHDRQQYEFANHLTNIYLEYTGDFKGLAILPYYQAYRAMVRAKVHLFDFSFSAKDSEQKQKIYQKYLRYIALAESYTTLPKPKLFITFGLSGSGKTTAARMLAKKTGAIQIRSDIVRKILAGMKPKEKSNSGVNQGLYTQELNDKTYLRLTELAKTILTAHYSVVVDAAFIKQHYRNLFADLAKQLQVPFSIVKCELPHEQLSQAIDQRNKSQLDVSEATLEVLEMQKETLEPLSGEEKEKILEI